MSLRVRLIVGVLLLTAAAIGAVSGATYLALSAFLTGRVDTQLLSAPPDVVERLCYRLPFGLPGPPVRPEPLLIARLDGAGRPVGGCVANGLSEPLRLAEADTARLLAAPGTPVKVDDAGNPARALARPDRDGGYQVIGQSLVEVRGILRRLLVLALVIDAVALAGVAGVGAWGVRWGLRPLDRVTATARAVAAEVSTTEVSTDTGGLGRRVPEGAQNTEVGQLAEAFNTMLTAVQTEVAGRRASEERMRRFLADASHELRTPLTSLRGYAELITMREAAAGARRDPESADALRRMTAEGARMSRLVEDLLGLARSDTPETGREQRVERVALDQLAADAVADLRAAHPSRTITLTVEPTGEPDMPDAERGGPGIEPGGSNTVTVLGNPDQLCQVVLNLLANAAMHSRPEGAIRVRVGRVQQHVRFSVSDDGPGLTPQQATHVFDRFWRADTARTRARGGGSGLGLSIVDTLVSSHDGTIDFDSAATVGTTVTVHLPAAR